MLTKLSPSEIGGDDDVKRKPLDTRYNFVDAEKAMELVFDG